MNIMDPELLSTEIIDIFKHHLPMDLCLELVCYYSEMRYPTKYLLMRRRQGNYLFEEPTTEQVIGIYDKLSTALFDYLRTYYANHIFHQYDLKSNTWIYDYATTSRSVDRYGHKTQIFQSQLELVMDTQHAFHYIKETPTNFMIYDVKERFKVSYYLYHYGTIRKYCVWNDEFDVDTMNNLLDRPNQAFDLPNIPALKSFKFPEK